MTQPSPSLAAERCGAGEAVVFLHGIGGNKENWRGQLDALSHRYSPVIFDFRGYGDSDKITSDVDLFDFVDDARRVMDRFEIERAHIVGLSMGGLVAQAFYRRHKERVLSLCLAACRPGSAPVPEDAGGFSQHRLHSLDQTGSIEALADSLLPRLLGRDVTPAVSAAIRDSLLRLHIPSYRKIMAARVRFLPFLDPATIAVPTLVLAGDADGVAPPAQMQALAAAIPGSVYEVFDRSGHLLNIEQRDNFNATLMRFLDAMSLATPMRAMSNH